MQEPILLCRARGSYSGLHPAQLLEGNLRKLARDDYDSSPGMSAWVGMDFLPAIAFLASKGTLI